MYAFDYRRPHSLNEADLALKAMPGAKLLAGGQTLIPTMKQRLARPEAIIDLGGIPDMRKITHDRDKLVIGAMATHASVAESQAVKAAIPGLAVLAEGIGDPHVRNRGTIGGSVANNDPAADYPAAVLALAASIVTNKRTIAADDFFKGLFTTALDEDEILSEFVFPVPMRFAYAKFPNPASRYALVGVAVGQVGSTVRVAVTGAGNFGVFRVPAMEAALTKSFDASALTDIKVDASGLNSDIHASADYRAHLVTVMAKRAVATAKA
jgi:aerobic carbon-monoxide dehydrogenase medium subunit